MINPVFSKEHPRLIFKEIILKSKLKKKIKDMECFNSLVFIIIE